MSELPARHQPVANSGSQQETADERELGHLDGAEPAAVAAEDAPSDAPEDGSGTSGKKGDKDSKDKHKLPLWAELPLLIAIAIGLALLLKTFAFGTYSIPSGSMEKTLLVGDRVLVNKLVYDFRDPHRGDIVVFNGDGTGFHSEAVVPPPSNVFSSALRHVQDLFGLGAPNEKDFVKRVIGVGGDRVQCCDSQGRWVVNGRALIEPYVFGADGNQPYGPVLVPKGQLFVLGDHRDDSRDSRYSGFVPVDKVIGKAFFRVWPVSRVGGLGKSLSYADGVAPLGVSAPVAAATVLPGGVALPILFAVPALRRRRRRRAYR